MTLEISTLPVSPGFHWIHPLWDAFKPWFLHTCLGAGFCVSFHLKSRPHCLFQQNSYCRGVQCACFSKDDKYVYAGLRDRSIIVWSVLDGESFCFENRTALRSGEESPVLGSWALEALFWPPLAGSLPGLYRPRGLAYLELQLLF